MKNTNIEDGVYEDDETLNDFKLAKLEQEMEDYLLALQLAQEEQMKISPKPQIKRQNTSPLIRIRDYFYDDFGEMNKDFERKLETHSWIEDEFHDEEDKEYLQTQRHRLPKQVFKTRGSKKPQKKRSLKNVKENYTVNSSPTKPISPLHHRTKSRELSLCEWKKHRVDSYHQVHVKRFYVPPQRSAHSAIVIPQGYMFIFGGMEKLKISNDMYCYNFATQEWDKIIPRGNVPPPVFDHTCIYNCKNSMILFGGAHGKKDILNKLNKDVYIFDLNTYQWSKVNVEGEIQPRYAHSANLYQNDMIVFGGFFREITNDEALYCLNLMTMKWSKMKQNGNIPEVRVYHSSVIYRNFMYVFGGLLIGLRPPKFSNELYEYNLQTNTWKIIESNISLPSRFMHTAVVHNDRMIVFGGSDSFTISNANNMRDKFLKNDSKNHAYAQLYEFIFPTKQWRKFTTHGDVPLLKKNHTAIVYKDAMWIFGGWIQNYMGDQSPFYQLNIGKRFDTMVTVVPTDFSDIIFKLHDE